MAIPGGREYFRQKRMRHKQRQPRPAAPAPRKLSDIIIEIARIGFKAPYRQLDPAPAAANLLMLLATQAWNREVYAGQAHPAFKPSTIILETMVRELCVSQAQLEQELISTNWETLLELMQIYKRKHFPADTRRIIASGYTPRGTLRVVWE